MPGGVHPPISVILSWPTPNYVNPDTEGPGLIIVCIIFSSITTVLVALRLWARFFLIRQPGLDDLFVVIGYIFVILLTALVLLANVKYGVGLHIWDLKLSKAAHARLVTWLSQFCVIIGSSSTKISVLLFYRRLASGSYTKAFLWAVRIGILYNAIYCVGFTLYIVVECRPLSAYWQQFSLQWSEKFVCGDEHLSLPVNGGLSVLSDFYATVLPGLLLRHLQMPKKQKMLLYCLFALGFLVVAAGICRTVYLDRVINRTYDTTWALWMMWIWTLIENYLAICCASVGFDEKKCILPLLILMQAPALKPLYVRYLAPPIAFAIGYVIRSSGKQSQYTGDSYTAASRTSRFGLTSTASSTWKADGFEKVHVRELSEKSARDRKLDLERGLGWDVQAGQIMVRNEILLDVEEVGGIVTKGEATDVRCHGHGIGTGGNGSSSSEDIITGEERHPSWMLPVAPGDVAWGINGRVYGGGGGMGRAL